jgi:hypothetical protein
MMEFLATIEDLLNRGHAVRFQADGWSMHPTIRYGEIIVIEPVGQAPIRAGDVLLYRRSRSAIAHRVIRLTPSAGGRSTLVLRGDAADCCDDPISLDQVLGRVIAVERRGRQRRFGRLAHVWRPPLACALRHLRNYRLKVTNYISVRSGMV